MLLRFTFGLWAFLFWHTNVFSANSAAMGAVIYESQGGNGSLMISNARDSISSIMISTIGANGHTCSFSGRLKKNMIYDDIPNNVNTPKCTVKVRMVSDRTIETYDSTSACASYCGLKASLEGTFIQPQPNCSVMARQARKNQFAQHFSRRDYNAAFVVLQQFYSDCGMLLNWIEKDEVLNDLAITSYRLGQPQMCRQLLNQTLAARYPSKAALEEEIGYPIDVISYESTARLIRINLHKCRFGRSAP